MGLERTTVQQKQAQAKEVQKEKHERLRRSLERSATEERRLLSACHNGALGRLGVRCRAAKHRREIELRGEVARVKNGFARLWREHNRNRCENGPPVSLTGGADAGAGRKKKLGGAEGECRPPSLGEQGENKAQRRENDRNAAGVADGEDGDIAWERKRGVRGSAGDREKRGADGKPPVEGNLSRVGVPGSGEMMDAGETAALAAEGERVEDEVVKVSTVPASNGGPKHDEEPRAEASSPRPAPTGRGMSGGKRGGAFRRRRKKKGIATNAAAAEETGSAPSVRDALGGADAAVGDGCFGVLSEGEARALAELGRGAPRDPRLLLSTFPLPPPRRRRLPESSSRTHLEELKEEGASLDLASGEEEIGSSGADGHLGTVRGESVGGECGGDEHDDVLDRAMEKLARKIQAEEELSRRWLGLAPPPA